MAELQPQITNNGPIVVSEFGSSTDWNELSAFPNSNSRPRSLTTDAVPSNSSVDYTCMHTSLTPISEVEQKTSLSSFQSSMPSIPAQQQPNLNAILSISETNKALIPKKSLNERNRLTGALPSSFSQIVSQVEIDNKSNIPVGTTTTSTNSKSSTKKTTFGVPSNSSTSTQSYKNGSSSSSPRKSTTETSSSSPRKSKIETSSSKKSTNQNLRDSVLTKSEEFTESISFSERQKHPDPSSYSVSTSPTIGFASSSEKSTTQESKVSDDSPQETIFTQTESPSLISPQNNTTETSNEPSPLKIPSSNQSAYQSTEEQSAENRPSTAKHSVNNQSSLKSKTRAIQKSEIITKGSISPDSHCCLLI